jgi:hypothetical protein
MSMTLDCGKCARCKAKLRKKKIRSIVFGALWSLWALGGIAGGCMAWNQAHQPPAPVTAEQRARNERLNKIDTAMDSLQNERDEIDPPPDDNGRESEHEYY